ncbi:MAG: pyridoxamine 5'-phosphate oxidase family protein [Vicinamibacteria bacterium]
MTEETKEQRKFLRDIIQGFDSAMLVTYSGRDSMSARPMSIAEVDHNDVMYFATDIASAKVDQLKMNPRAYLTFQNGKRWASVTGSVRVLRDRALIGRLWSEAWKVWFPKGMDDPSICILAFDAEEGEYWDNSGVNALKYLLKAAKAYATGTKPKVESEEHGKVTL